MPNSQNTIRLLHDVFVEVGPVKTLPYHTQVKSEFRVLVDPTWRQIHVAKWRTHLEWLDEGQWSVSRMESRLQVLAADVFSLIFKIQRSSACMYV